MTKVKPRKTKLPRSWSRPGVRQDQIKTKLKAEENSCTNHFDIWDQDQVTNQDKIKTKTERERETMNNIENKDLYYLTSTHQTQRKCTRLSQHSTTLSFFSDIKTNIEKVILTWPISRVINVVCQKNKLLNFIGIETMFH